MHKQLKLLDCTLRDGGYYNSWDFSYDLVQDYLQAMVALKVDFVEIGFRTLKNHGFKGGYAYSTDAFLNSLNFPVELESKLGVMVNGSELVHNQNEVLDQLFNPKKNSPVTLVRIACHVYEFEQCLPAATWLKEQGYTVGFNLMQVADRTSDEITQLAKKASKYPIDVLYFADSMGSLSPKEVTTIVKAFNDGWSGPIGIHTHDNMGQAIANSLQAINNGVTWVDSTITGMGRGPGNAQTEYLSMAIEPYSHVKRNPTKLFELIRKHFKPLQDNYGWGTNPYYYMAGQHGIHPTYIQAMLQDSRYSDEDILAVIDHLKIEGGKKFSVDTLESARHFFSKNVIGTWSPKSVLENKTIMILGAGPSVEHYREYLERFITDNNIYVIALNTQQSISSSLINVRAACHPVRLLADCHEHLKLSQPLITPASMLPSDVKSELSKKRLLDFGISIEPSGFKVESTYCQIPTSLVIAYALAIASSGQAKHIYLAGFDGYGADDPRRKEMDNLLRLYQESTDSVPITSLTPTRYEIEVKSIFGYL